jgi:cephalosporin-C deacetylase-like acetyl esterase
MHKKTLASLFLLAAASLAASAQTQPSATTSSQPAARGRGGRGPALPAIAVTADHADWNYVPGETAKFIVTAPAGTAITYTVGPEMMPAQSKTATIPEAGKLEIDGGTMKDPGFLRCAVTAQGFSRGIATAGFSPEKIKPTQTEPADFDAFWAKAKAELASIPMDPKLTPLPQYNTANADAFEVNLQNIGTSPAATSRFYGILYVPKGDGPFPAMMSPPGAGVRGPDRDIWNWSDPSRNFIVLYVGIHEMPVVPATAPAGGGRGATPQVSGNYPNIGLENPAQYYFRRVLMGCVRANDYLVSLPKWDKKNLVAYGGSQGGYLSITTTALDPRVTALCPAYPAYCDETGYVNNRPAGWPAMRFADLNDPQRNAKIATTAYYDGVNFAKRIKVPGHYAWGYNDETCPPTTTFSAYNLITAPKDLTIIKEMTHARVPRLTDIEHDWVMKHLK